MSISADTRFRVRLVRYVASRLRHELPDKLKRLDSAVAWWAHSIREASAPPVDFKSEVQVLQTVANLIDSVMEESARTREEENHIAPGVPLKSETSVRETGSEEKEDWERVLREFLVHEKGFLFPADPDAILPEASGLKSFQWGSAIWQEIFPKIRIAATEEITALLIGEPGSGKTHVAKSIHNTGPRREQPLVVVPCEGLNAETFTFESARLLNNAGVESDGKDSLSLFRFKGTLLLEEVGRLKPDVQKLLLQGMVWIEEERAAHGSDRNYPRLLATTSVPLEKAYLDGKFNQDLFYRLAIFQIDLPPLRQRKADIPELVQALLVKLAAIHRMPLPIVEDEAMRKLERHAWQGNIRELENVLNAALKAAEQKITPDHIWLDHWSSGKTTVQGDPVMERVLERLESLGVHISKGNPETFVQFLRLTNGRRFRTQELAEDLNIASSTARAYIHRLVKANILRKFGEKKGTSYQVIDRDLIGK